MQIAEIVNQFHFVRPLWLWVFLVLIALLWIQSRHVRNSRSWQAVCDPQLLPHILAGTPGRERRWPLVVTGFVGVLAILALAGPAWKQLEQPVFRDQSALVIALDLSRSMDAEDIKPSRLGRARLKVIDILKQRSEGQTALIVYAAEPFVVSPLTDDADTIVAMVPTLSTSLMPSQGSRADLALVKAMQLLQQAGVPHGDILLVTDGIDSDRLEGVVSKLTRKGDRLSILGVGTVEGAPIATGSGGFLKDRDGSIVIPKLDEQDLRAIALQGGGNYRTLSTDDRDIERLMSQLSPGQLDVGKQQAGFKADIWQEEGPWLLLLVIPFAALTFRRGYLMVLLLLFLPMPGSAYALGWSDLWQRTDQQAARVFEEGKPDKAAGMFEDPQWRAAAYYRAGDYQQSLQALEGLNTPDAWYNKGNALARLGRLDEAINAYNMALDLDPNHEDARYNRDQVRKLLKRQASDQNRSQSQQSQDSDASPGNDDRQRGSQKDRSRQDQQGQQANAKDSENGTQPESPHEASQQARNDGQQTDHQDDKKDAKEQNAVNAMQHDGDQQQDKDQARQAQAQVTDDLTDNNETQQANEQWLRRIPDDPGGLLRRKFLYQSQQSRGQEEEEEQPW